MERQDQIGRGGGERQPLKGFDIARIAGNLKGWELGIFSEDSEISSYSFSRMASQERHLVLNINPFAGRVRFQERVNGSVDFSITCTEITLVELYDNLDEMTFRGNVHYRIDLDGMGHEVRLGYNQEPIVTRTYDFDPPKK